MLARLTLSLLTASTPAEARTAAEAADAADAAELAFGALVFEDLHPELAPGPLEDLAVDLPGLTAPLRSDAVALWLWIEHRLSEGPSWGEGSRFFVGLELGLEALLEPAAGPLGVPRLERRRRARCRELAVEEAGDLVLAQARAARRAALGCPEAAW